MEYSILFCVDCWALEYQHGGYVHLDFYIMDDYGTLVYYGDSSPQDVDFYEMMCYNRHQ